MMPIKLFYIIVLFQSISVLGKIQELPEAKIVPQGGIPGLAKPLDRNGDLHYIVEVHSGKDIILLHVHQTRSEDELKKTHSCTGRFRLLNGFTHSFVNIEQVDVTKDVQLWIKLADGTAIGRATLYPDNGGAILTPRSGHLEMTLHKPGQYVVDVDNWMSYETFFVRDVHSVTKEYSGKPIHSLTIFYNPPLEIPCDPSVQFLHVGDPFPATLDTDKHTLLFAPGVHDIGEGVMLQSHVHYHIPADAVVYGSFMCIGEWAQGNSLEAMATTKCAEVQVKGYGVISGEKISWSPDYDDACKKAGTCPTTCRKQNSIPYADYNVYPTSHVHYHLNDRHKKRAITVMYGKHFRLFGPTIVDPAFHAVNVADNSKWDNGLIRGGDHALSVEWIKIIGWRINGDGIHVHRWAEVSNSFVRAQDDSVYAASGHYQVHIDNMVVWNDANGASFLLSGGNGGWDTRIQNSDVVFARKSTDIDDGGRVFSCRGLKPDEQIRNIHFNNIRIHDPHRTLEVFNIAPGENRHIDELRFNNIEIMYEDHESKMLPSGTKRKNVFAGTFTNLQFEMVYYTHPITPSGAAIAGVVALHDFAPDQFALWGDLRADFTWCDRHGFLPASFECVQVIHHSNECDEVDTVLPGGKKTLTCPATVSPCCAMQCRQCATSPTTSGPGQTNSVHQMPGFGHVGRRLLQLRD